MNAPDRRVVITRAIEPYAYLWDQTLAWAAPMTSYEDRVRTLLPKVCEALNDVDRGQWGVLHKDDRGPAGVGYVPYDIVVWDPTKEHFDIFTDKPRVTWGENGPIPANKATKWRWLDARVAVTRGLIPDYIPTRPGAIPVPPVPPVDNRDDQVERLFTTLDELRGDVSNLIRGQSDIQDRLQQVELLLQTDVAGKLREVVAQELGKWAQTPAVDTMLEALMKVQFSARILGQQVTFTPSIKK